MVMRCVFSDNCFQDSFPKIRFRVGGHRQWRPRLPFELLIICDYESKVYRIAVDAFQMCNRHLGEVAAPGESRATRTKLSVTSGGPEVRISEA